MEIRRNINQFFTKGETWVYFVLIIIISHIAAHQKQHALLSDYLSYSFIQIIYFAPLFFLIYWKQSLQSTYKSPFFNIFWIALQAIYLLIVNQLNLAFGDDPLLPFPEEFLVFSSVYFVLISILLSALKYFKYRVKLQNKLIQKISLNKALLLALFLFAGFMSTIATSSYESLYANKTIEVGINYEKIIHHFPLFLAIWGQIYIAYLAGFFFHYINNQLLVPKLLKQKGIVFYLAGAFGTIFLFYPLLAQFLIWLPLHQQTPILLPSENYIALDSINASVALAIVAISLPVTLAIDWFKQNNAIVNLEKQQVATELDLLKQQINPHFFFNTLNNLYALSLTQSKKTPEVILQLSELMRYVIYKGKEKQVTIDEEMKYLADYIHLQQLRIHQPIALAFEQHIEMPNLSIPPLLFIILVENAFKHGIEPAEGSSSLYLSIRSDDKSLEFYCSNSYEKGNEDKGIGLVNLKRRLSLLYPNKHQLTLQRKDSTFEATLKLDLA